MSSYNFLETTEMTYKYKILIIAPAWVGDLVMSQTLLKFLHKKYNNNVVIDIFAAKFLHGIIARMPEVTNIIENPFQHKELKILNRIKVGWNLRKNHYNEVIVLPNSLKSSLVPFFSGIKIRTGFIGESRYILLNNYFKLDPIALPLMIDRFCALGNNGVKVDGIEFPSLTIDLQNQEKLRQRFNLHPDKITIAFCPAAEYGRAKRWPAEYFAKLLDLLNADKYQIIILGGPKDTLISKEICQHTKKPPIDLCGKTTLADTIDLLSLAKYTVTNDSGLMHIAASVNSKILAIYGSTSPKFTPPLCNNAEIININLPCSPCFERTCRFGHYNCLKLITPELILAKLDSTFQ
jgi:heptosyltransferase II